MAASVHQLGMLAEQRGDHTEAERLYRQAVATNERLGNPTDAATGWSQLGNLATITGDPAAAASRHARAAAMRRSLGLPQARYDLTRLATLRAELGEAAFREAAGSEVDEATPQELIDTMLPP